MSNLQRLTGTKEPLRTATPEVFAKPARFRAAGAAVAFLALGVIVGAQANAQGLSDFNTSPELAQAGPGDSPGSGAGAQTGQPSAPSVRAPSEGERAYPQGSDPQADGQDDLEVPDGPGCRDRNEPLNLLV